MYSKFEKCIKHNNENEIQVRSTAGQRPSPTYISCACSSHEIGVNYRVVEQVAPMSTWFSIVTICSSTTRVLGRVIIIAETVGYILFSVINLLNRQISNLPQVVHRT